MRRCQFARLRHRRRELRRAALIFQNREDPNTSIETAHEACHDCQSPHVQFQCTSRSREAIMKRTSIVASVMLSALALFGSLGGAVAQSDCKTLVKASPFGADDQVGATNRITP